MKTVREHSASVLFVLVLLGLFAVFSTILVVMGAKCYQHLVTEADTLSERRVMTSFVRSTVRCDEEAGVFSTEEDGRVLCVNYDYDGEKYVKRLYACDGFLMESFISSDKPFTPEAGETLCGAKSFSVTMDGGLLTATVTAADDTEIVIPVALHTAGPGKESD